MEIVITMAGQGLRFKKAGYREPKYMIEALGRTLFEWSMDSLKAFREEGDRYTFIVRKEDRAGDFIRKKAGELGIGSVRLLELREGTDGQATTALLARDGWDRKDGLYIYNIDTYAEPYSMTREELKGDGFIPCFKGEGDHWSFVRLKGDNGEGISELPAEEVREKVRISEYCTLGAYYFRSCGLYEEVYEDYYLRGSSGRGEGEAERRERYIAPMYDHMIKQGMKVYISCVQKERVHVLGTPEELDVFRAQGYSGTVQK